MCKCSREVSCAKTTEPIKMPLGARVLGPRNLIFDGGPDPPLKKSVYICFTWDQVQMSAKVDHYVAAMWSFAKLLGQLLEL